MAEAEVSLRLAFWLFDERHSTEVIDVAIDGAQVQTADTAHFNLRAFMAQHNWTRADATEKWQGEWLSAAGDRRIRVHCTPGRGDLVAHLGSGKTLRVECKKGPLHPSRSSQEYPLIREALGSLLTVGAVEDDDILAVAVPYSSKFEKLAERWRAAPLIGRLGIRILTVDRSGRVSGW
jgi:hypothetical protein